MAAVFNLVLAVFLIMVIALFCCELSRYFLARDELKTNTEAAALCCETALVSSGDPLNPTNQQNAVNTALSLFQQNTVLGQSMSNAALAATPGDLSPSAGQAQICFQFLNPVTRQPINNGQPGNNGSPPSGALIQATGAYCYTPALGQFIGLGQAQFTFQVSAFSGVPRIDIVIAFDVSGYQDLHTPGSPVQVGGPPPPNNTSTGGPPDTTTGGPATTGGCVWAYGQGIRYMAPQMNGTPLTGNTISDIIGHPGCSGKEAGHVFPPFNWDCIDPGNFPNSITWSESPSSPSTNTLIGFNGNTGTSAFTNVVPGNVCCLPPPNNNNNGGNHNNDGGNHNNDGGNNNNNDGNSSSYLNNQVKTKLIASTKTNSGDDLEQLCSAINAAAGKQKIKAHHLQSKDIFSTMPFLPAIFAYPMASGSNNATTGANQPYVAPDGETYFDGSHTNTSPPAGQNNYTSAIPPANPGNCPPTGGPSLVAAGKAVDNVFTHLVVNIDGQNTFGGFTDQNGYYFPDQGMLAAALCGDLESQSAANNALVDTNSMGVTPQAGYAAAYYKSAYAQLQPLQDLLNAASTLIYEMRNVADVHFSFIAFNDVAGDPSTGLNPASYSDTPQSGYLPMISGLFLYPAPTPTPGQTATYVLPSLPFVPLDPNNANTDLMTMLPTIQPHGSRNVAAALQAAVSQFQTNGRPGANKAIVLFCSGVPTEANTGNDK